MKNIFQNYIAIENIAIFKEEISKENAINKLISLLCKKKDTEIHKKTKEAIWEREQLMSTGIGVGIAVPHARVGFINSPEMAIGISKDGIKDYISLDNNPVNIMVLILAGEKQHALYISLLAEIISNLKSPLFRDKLLNSDSQIKILELFKGNK